MDQPKPLTEKQLAALQMMHRMTLEEMAIAQGNATRNMTSEERNFVENKMPYKFVTREEYLEANQAGKESLFFKALAERDAYREVAINWPGYSEDRGETAKVIDSEAARLLEGK